jgi:endonuclease/exonuclease/phosphatase family metal-dependent hydrolase
LALVSSLSSLLFVACGTAPQNASSAQTLGSGGTTAWTGHVRVMAANASTGNAQSYDPGEGIRIFQGLHPDIALVQEVNYGSDSTADIRAFVDTAFGAEFAYAREDGAQIPNAVMSRFPIVESGTWADPQVGNRGFTWAHIQLPNSHDLWAVSLHLLTSGASQRAAEAQSLVSLIQGKVPAGAELIVGGDLNTDQRTEPCMSTLGALVGTDGPYPADQSGNDNTSINRNHPHDWVTVDSTLAAAEIPVAMGPDSFSHGLVFDSRVFTPLAEVTPVQLEDSGAPGMQHMPVVRDFQLSVGP